MTAKKTSKGMETTKQSPPSRAACQSDSSGRGISKDKAVPIVGLGASAGGLEALEVFFSHLPLDTGMAFVVVQHLSSGHQSIMDTLLKKHTAMPVVQIEDGVTLEADCIYLNQPDKEVDIHSRALYLRDPQVAHGFRRPIDSFFCSLAREGGERSIAIILSGSGSDGSQGIKAIKEVGGLVMVQEESQARYEDMPRHAIETGMVDFVLPVEQMPETLRKYLKHPYADATRESTSPQKLFEDALNTIFILIRGQTGHDFSNYKKNTIRRRIERRMAVHQIDRIGDYVHLLQTDSTEVEALYRDMLITVTRFFRDPDAFAILENTVVPKLLARRASLDPIRIWVAGCGTGEEAYSLAMILSEIMSQSNTHVDVQIFATDLDNAAVEFARYGIYPESISADVSAERLQRFFVSESGGYKIKRQIRERVVFAVQNLIKDPPFSRLDMVSCRNVLIYMDALLQRKILPLFHYTLNSEGILFLGSSENVGEFMDCFEAIDKKWKLFRRRDAALARRAEQPRLPFHSTLAPSASDRAGEKAADIDVRQLAERTILKNYAPPCVLVNEKYEILHFYGETDRFLSLPTGEPSFHILKIAREEICYKLNRMLQQVFHDRQTVVTPGLQIRHEGRNGLVDLVVEPLSRGGSETLAMVIFEEQAAPSLQPDDTGGATAAATTAPPEITALEQELASTKEYLQTTIEELETSNEELKSTNEELQSTNEELQSTNEELETSREELQSTNEELETVNTELHDKVHQLSQANDDLNNLLASTQIATIFLDMDLCIRRFTPTATLAFNFRPADLGRPISDITSKLKYSELDNDVRGVLETLREKHAEIETCAGIWMAMHILPYRTTENVIDGLVITFTDIDHIKEGDQLRRLATVLKDSNDAVTVQELDGRITAWNRGAETLYGYSEGEALHLHITDLVPEDERQQALDLIVGVQSGQKVTSLAAHRLCKDGRCLTVWFTVTALHDAEGNIVAVATTERDISNLDELKPG